MLFAGLNSEKALWLSLVVIVLQGRCRLLGWGRALLYAALPAIGYALVRLTVAHTDSRYTLSYIWQLSRERAPQAVIVLCMGVLLWLVLLVKRWPRVHPYLKLILLLSLAYVVPNLVFGVSNELPRLLSPVGVLVALATIERTVR